MDATRHNQTAWDKKVIDGSVYTKPVSEERIKNSKLGIWEITVTTTKPVPKNWFPKNLNGLKILCLAAGGGQQAPILSAAGADVTVMDISEKQLDQDRIVAKRDGLYIKTIQGDMSDLSCFDAESFDMIIHPVSNLFVENISTVWQEAYRVLKNNGTLIAGFTNPLLFIFDDEQEMNGNLVVRNSIPCSSISSLNDEEVKKYLKSNQTIEFAHTLEDQIQGQINAGFVITGFYEDDFGGTRVLDKYIKTFIATKAVKLMSHN